MFTMEIPTVQENQSELAVTTARVETESGTALRNRAWKPVQFTEMGITPPLMANALILKETVNMF